MFFTQRIQGFRDCLQSLARDRFAASVREAVRAFLDFLQGPIDARETFDVANHQVAIALERVELLRVVLELLRAARALLFHVRFVGFRP